ncbi:hypothetical protein CHLNCDRAFT_21329 [Chlorella variabilis]|uniref:Protein kinase domain-containing protein n=1 Tax=Chlorella variabilis TaxID=554065 RepID=E1Z9X5_CHLVA|nr:hypothetical protein CHLNCDRAFT_21329 [Chlorella variabilis]EFN57849.1 hypothetical protein CHLNCDRAFT_21329 [Chlorella variabilis]|eukprot:XP_005849951.1 hypothetical protein CHLNCDRAFT_21329 [Chlorella variabilis]
MQAGATLGRDAPRLEQRCTKVQPFYPCTLSQPHLPSPCGCPAVLQEFCARGSLLQAIDSGVLKLPNGAPNLPAILTAAQEIAGACLYLHRHDIVHGDLTPGNVLLATSSRDARRWVCKVGDFGLAQIIHPDATEIYSSCFGTLTHAAPELVVEGMLTKAADVFSFGVILLEMYSSKRVWRGYSFMQILSAISEGKLPFVIPADCPEALASLLHRCLHTDPMQRPTFDVVLAEVQAMLRGVPRAMGAGAPPQPTSVSVRGPSSPAGPQPAPKHESPFAQAAVTRAGSGPLITMSEPHA